MSRAYVGLVVTCIGTTALIYYVHWDQKKELARMREGVYLDAVREASRREALGMTGKSSTGEQQPHAGNAVQPRG